MNDGVCSLEAGHELMVAGRRLFISLVCHGAGSGVLGRGRGREKYWKPSISLSRGSEIGKGRYQVIKQMIGRDFIPLHPIMTVYQHTVQFIS